MTDPRTPSLASVLAATALLSGCATAPRADLAGFAATTSAVRGAVEQNFGDANRLARGVAIEDFVRSGAIGLSERRFPPAVPPQTVAAWRDSLADLQRYANLLASLASGTRGSDATGAMRGLGIALRDGRSGVDIDAGVASAFAGLAGAMIDARANSTALDLLRQTDPDVRRLLTAMADSIGRDDTTGLRATVHSNWTAALSDLQAGYARAATEKAEGRQRTIVTDFLAGVDQRDAHLAALAGVRASLIALADAHSAAAAGVRRPFEANASDIAARLEVAEDTFRAIEGARPR